ncbi:MAG TPA: WD40 repeat domain-containing protein, partial [Gemmataceae bacterium]|nr:WD40 repeat domain-containing protein [Gemmataceae bacterium]
WFVRSLAFSPNGKLLAFPRGTGVCVWDLAAGKELFQLDSGTKWSMGGTVFSADGKRLAAASNPYERGTDYTIHLWNVETGKEAGALKGHEGSIWSLAIASKGNLLASTSFDRTIRFWDLTKQREIGRISGPNRVSRALSFSADGSVLASGHIFGDLHLWDARTYKEIATPAAGSTFVEWVRFAPDGQTLISAAPEQIGLWEPLTGRQRRVFSSKSLVTGGLFWHPSLSPDGKYLATGSDRTQGQALLWDVADGKLVRKFGESGQLRVYSVMFSPDGRRLAGTSYEPNITHIWDAAGGKELLQLKGQNLPHALAFSPDGATLAVSSGWANTDMTVGLWNLATGREIWRKTTRPWLAMDVQFSPDGRTLALVGAMPGRINTKGEFHLWEAATGKELKQIEGHQLPVHCLAFSADGRMLATGSNDNAVHLWEIGSGGERRCFQGHQNHIWALSFSPDGRLLASASGDTTALVWDLTDNFRDGRFQPRRLSAAELARCWNDLALSDAGRAYRSILSLIGSPKETTTFLKDHVPPVIAADPKRVAPLLAALDSEKFAERDKAMIELEKLGLAVESSLRAALSAKPSLEIRQRIEAILEKLAGEPRLRFLRALEVLEHIATPEARQLVEALSRGTAELWPAQEAKASLARLAARPALQP